MCHLCTHKGADKVHICAAKYTDGICHDEETSSYPTVVSTMNTMIYRKNHLNYEGWEADRVVIIQRHAIVLVCSIFPYKSSLRFRPIFCPGLVDREQPFVNNKGEGMSFLAKRGY